MYRFALRPRWLVGHVVVVLLVALMVSLGLWQLRRLDERRDANAAVLRGARTTAPLDAVLSPDADAVGRAEYRRVEVRGTFDERGELLVRFRTSNGLPGYDVATPLVTRPGVAVLVNRGWRPLEVEATSPPAGEVVVTGLVRADERDPVRLDRDDSRVIVSALDSATLAPVVGYDLYPGWLHLSAPDDPSSFPELLPPPDPGEGPHLSYALQWFAFSTIAVVGWVLLVRSSARRRKRPTAPAAPPPNRAPDG